MQIIMIFYTSKTPHNRGCSRRRRNAHWRDREGRNQYSFDGNLHYSCQSFTIVI